ncbi:major facilitator superfamily transporter [Colletotrichum sojae]|uniref:Major facilitator superfamily transporter n=1 Tax=Colletotrichum sojae TaxID=2175907 RepID=A0A8H6IVZ0_9PEZI|nr:major facilitator superfamily transporter [Colletotrichum sojae]
MTAATSPPDAAVRQPSRELQRPDDAATAASDKTLQGSGVTRDEETGAVAAPSADDEPDYPTGWKRAMIVVPVTLCYFLIFLDLAVVSTATPAITSSFNSLTDVGWYGGAYQLGSSAFQPLSGKIYQHFHAKASILFSPSITTCISLGRWSFLAFFFIFEVGSLICAVATSSPMFIVGRTIAGAGSSGLANGALTIISSIMPPRAQAKFLGINMGLGQLGIAMGPILGGVFTEFVSWRWCFWINLPVGVPVAVLLLLFRIPQPGKKPALQVLGTAVKSLDLPGFMLIGPAAVMFLLGLQYGGNQYPWDSSVVIGLIVGAGVTFGLFLFWEHRKGDEAMVPFVMLKHKVIWSAAGNMFFLLASVLVADYYLAIYFQAVNNDSPLMSGVHMLPTTLGLVLFTVTGGVMTELLGYYLPWVIGGSSMSAIGYGLMSTFTPYTEVAKWVGYQIFYGVGSGAMSSGAYIAVQNTVPTPQIPIAMAIIIFMQNMGGAIFLIAANAIFSNTLRRELQSRAELIGIEPEAVIAAGAKAVRTVVPAEGLSEVLEAYSAGVGAVMYLGVGLSIATWAFGWGLGWKDIRKTKKLQALQASDSEKEEKKVEKVEKK